MNVDTITEHPFPFVGKKVRSDGPISDALLTDALTPGLKRVLIIEENGEMRDHFKQFLSGDFELLVVANPAEAIAAASLYPIHIVVLDVQHEKEYEAVSLSKQLRKLNSCKDACFISITGYVLPEGKSILKRMKYDYHIAKPFTLRRLRSLLHLCVAKETLSILNSINIEVPAPISTTVAELVS